MPAKHNMSDDEQPEVEGHRRRFNGLDEQGNEFSIPEENILSVKWTDADGEHEVEGHGIRYTGLSDEPEVEGQGYRFGGLSDDPEVRYTIRFTDEQGEEQEVEGHMYRMSDLRLKRDVGPLDGALARLGSIRPS